MSLPPLLAAATRTFVGSLVKALSFTLRLYVHTLSAEDQPARVALQTVSSSSSIKLSFSSIIKAAEARMARCLFGRRAARSPLVNPTRPTSSREGTSFRLCPRKPASFPRHRPRVPRIRCDPDRGRDRAAAILRRLRQPEISLSRRISFYFRHRESSQFLSSAYELLRRFSQSFIHNV